MRTSIIYLFLFLGMHLGVAQDTAFLSYDEALYNAQKENKILVIQFSGTDWCPPCIRLEKEILNQSEFEDYAQQFVWLRADFPRKKANRLSKEHQGHNDALAETYNKQGYFPLLVFIDTSEKVIGNLGYQSGNVEKYISLIDDIIE
jgi:thioredoxin-related protein